MRIYQSPKNELSKEHREAIKQMMELSDILLANKPNDKRFKRYENGYLLDYITILMNIEQEHYSDAHIQKAINSLHKRVFKNRRY